MSNSPDSTTELKTRQVGTTELSWCKAVPGGTGITVLALLLSKPLDSQILQNALRKLQSSHPVLGSKLRFDPATNSFSYVTPETPGIEVQLFDAASVSPIVQENGSDSVPPLQVILEHELNRNSWQNPDHSSDADLFYASMYTLENDKWVVALRLHTSVCDRASAVALLDELLMMLGMEEVETGVEREREVGLGIEDYIPSGQGNKPFWARGVDMLGYSLNSLRLSNLSFEDTVSPRLSRIVRLQMNAEDTGRVLSSCKSREIKLCGLLGAAGLIASHSLKGLSEDQWEKYAVVTLMDCRPILDPVLSSNHIGFYHSAIMNSHDIKGGENIWEVAKRVYSSFDNSKKNKKHFSDMADLNFLMCKAIENPGLTPSASLRTSLISVFEDPIIDNSGKLHQVLGIEDFIGCASVHGVGPSLAIFDTIRDEKLDCACVFPFPLHSREQMQDFVDEMKRVILEGTV